MAYLTLDAAIALARRARLNGLDMSEPLYFHDIGFYGIHERKHILGMMELMRNPKYFFAVLYFPSQESDTQQYIHEPGRIRYHSDEGCPDREPGHRTYLVPGPIREKGRSAVRSYRMWFRTVRHFLDQGKAEIFLAHLKAKWDITVQPTDIVQVNGEYTDAYARDLHKLENRIDQLLKAAAIYREQTDMHREILDKYDKATFLAYTPGRLRDNTTSHDDKAVKEILNAFDNTFKKPLRRFLFDYYRLLYNPDLYFNSNMLNRAGLDKCTHCHRKEYQKSSGLATPDTVKFEDILYLRSLNWKWEDVSGLN